MRFVCLAQQMNGAAKKNSKVKRQPSSRGQLWNMQKTFKKRKRAAVDFSGSYAEDPAVEGRLADLVTLQAGSPTSLPPPCFVWS